jgi:protein-S-isoprenylcysteine O-methyltransferase Ste14
MRWNWLVRSRAWVSLLIIAPFAIGCVFSKPPAVEGSWGDLGCDFIGWFLFMVGAGWRWWATIYIGGRKHWMIVTDGPYSVCRNPLYVGTLFMSLAVVFFLESFTLGLGLILMSGYYLSITVLTEEQMLREKFGQPFDEYCQRVPRFWPRFRLLQTPQKLIVSVRGLWSEAMRTSRWLWLPVLCELVSYLRAEAWWPRLFHLP